MKAVGVPKIWDATAGGPGRDEVVVLLGQQVGACDKKLRALERDFELIPKKEMAYLLAKRDEIGLWVVRRRTLIEVWELITNKVWLTQPKQQQRL